MVTRAAPPQVLTMDGYRSAWEPQGWQLIIIGPTSTWRQDWGEWEAIRDIVQNALDESEHYTWGFDVEGLYIRDVGKGVAVAEGNMLFLREEQVFASTEGSFIEQEIVETGAGLVATAVGEDEVQKVFWAAETEWASAYGGSPLRRIPEARWVTEADRDEDRQGKRLRCGNGDPIKTGDT